MYEIKVKADFSAAHNLKNYHGKCEHLHGHNWIVEANLIYNTLGKDGMAIDFKEAKRALKDAVESLDHAYLNEVSGLKDINPTSENIAKFIYDRVKKNNKNLASISVWENEDSCATYSRGAIRK
jgi:6-pyruvoyltetrahydropterin/6-carboxytetrahydropterin synthase